VGQFWSNKQTAVRINMGIRDAAKLELLLDFGIRNSRAWKITQRVRRPLQGNDWRISLPAIGV
jgi:hypothetical protein